MNMNYEPIQRWANSAANAAGKALNQSKDLFYSAREKAYDAAERAAAAHRREQQQAAAYWPKVQHKWHDLVDGAGDQFSRATSHIHDRFHYTERTLLKVGGLFLLFKCFSHRKQPVNEIVTEVRARVEQRPIESAIIALGIGYAIGKILR